MILIAVAVGLWIAGGVFALLASPWPRAASSVAAASVVAGGSLALIPTLRVLVGDEAPTMHAPWGIPYGELSIGMDRLSAFFLVPVLILPAVAAVFGRSYLLSFRQTKSLGPPWFFYNLFVASMAVVTLARNGVLFLLAWEVMALTAYALVTFGHESAEVRRAGWVYLIATHVGTAALVGMFLALAHGGDRYDFEAFRADFPSARRYFIVMVLAVIGFGAKAGFVPMHVWLPEAHAAAPSHVSAVMSGVLIKMGVYGLLRIVVLTGEPATWLGPSLIAIGFAGALLGIALAIYQRDLKRALAYSSVENVGLVTVGLGLGFWGRTSGRPDVAALGMTAALFHVWSHALMKGAMFLGAGSVLHGAGTKNLERLGGLLRRMPWTGLTLIVGATALAALPPMNGFVTEWLLLLALIRGGTTPAGQGNIAALLGVGALTFVGAMAALSFVRLAGISLLGQPRSDDARHAHEASRWMLAPMGLLVTACVLVALFPARIIGVFSPLAADLAAARLDPLTTPLTTLGACNAGLWAALGCVALVLRNGTRKARATAAATWGCGYAAPTARMQYTGESFAELFEAFLPSRLRSRVVDGAAPHRVVAKHWPPFPRDAQFATEAVDPLTRGLYEPFFARWGTRFARLRWLQQGVLHAYMLYILVALLLGFAWVSLCAWRGV